MFSGLKRRLYSQQPSLRPHRRVGKSNKTVAVTLDWTGQIMADLPESQWADWKSVSEHPSGTPRPQLDSWIR